MTIFKKEHPADSWWAYKFARFAVFEWIILIVWLIAMIIIWSN